MKKVIQYCLVASALVLLNACSSKQPQQVLMSPQLTSNEAQGHGQSFNLLSYDLRSNRFLLSIHDGDKEQAQLISSSSNVRKSMQQQLQQTWTQQGYALSDSSPQTITVEILELVSKVDQGSVKHNVTSTMRLKATVDTPSNTLVKQYRSVNTREGAFSLDIQQQAELMSDQFSQLLQQIVDDPQLLELLE